MRQVEIARTIVFDQPSHARGCFEALIVDNLDLGRPHNVETSSAAGCAATPSARSAPRSTAETTAGVLLNVFYRHSRIKQYLKDGRAMRVETVINSPRDLGCQARLHNLDDLQTKAVPATGGSWRLNGSVRAASMQSSLERIAHATVDAADDRIRPYGFGDPRVMALTGALCHTLLAATGPSPTRTCAS